MAAPNIPAAKRSGLSVDIARLAREGDGWLTPEERYALKTRGVCAQLQPGVFMIRVRVPAGRIQPGQLRGLAAVADDHGFGWLHLSTRQNVELHHVRAEDVPGVLARVEALGLTTSSACGHTMRNVMACPDAGVSLDEPFDCAPDARWVSDGVLARSVELNCVLPSRVNFAFGGCPACAGHARLNDGGFESRIIDGEPGYRLWAGGSLGTMPRLGVLVADFMPRAHARAAAEALVDVFVAHGDLDDPKKGRLKYAVDRLGGDGLRAAFTEAMSRATGRDLGDPPLVGVPDPAAHAAVLARVPAGGWSTGVRPQRTPGVATVTVHVPLGDLDATDARAVAGLASLGDGTVYLTRNQNVAFRDVPLEALGGLRRALDGVGLSLRGAETATDVRACTGSAVCSLGITAAPSVAARLADIAGLARNAALRVHVSGCPNSCAQHQAADIGLSGAKVRLSGRTRLGYHLWLGGDLETGELGVVAGRVADDDAPSVVDAVIGLWEALRRPGERLADTVRRVGVDDFAAHVGALAGGFEAGDDAADERPKVPALI